MLIGFEIEWEELGSLQKQNELGRQRRRRGQLAEQRETNRLR
jgi:hypothetical protein